MPMIDWAMKGEYMAEAASAIAKWPRKQGDLF
jgi:hypothetical protein